MALHISVLGYYCYQRSDFYAEVIEYGAGKTARRHFAQGAVRCWKFVMADMVNSGDA